MTPKLLKTNEVAKLLFMSEGNVMKWAREGKLPYIRTPGGCMRFDAKTVVVLAEQRRP